MVQGVSSDAGKSFLVTAICRWSHRRGMRVAPFKAQNMSNNARVVDGGEIGTAQWLQAQAAGARPDVRMNPVLVKPQGESSSQVVVNEGAESCRGPGKCLVDPGAGLDDGGGVAVTPDLGTDDLTKARDGNGVDIEFQPLVAELAQDARVCRGADVLPAIGRRGRERSPTG
jgi:hypothetical protein